MSATREANQKIISSIQDNDIRHFLSSANSFKKHDNKRKKTFFFCPAKNQNKFRKDETFKKRLEK